MGHILAVFFCAALITLSASCSNTSETQDPELITEEEQEQEKEKKKKKITMTPLVEFVPEVKLVHQWQVRIGKGQDKNCPCLYPAIDNQFIYVASYDGTITALNKKNGTQVWSTLVPQTITSGVAANNNLVVIGTIDGQVHAFNANNGQLIWQVDTASEMRAPALVKEKYVYTQSVGGILSVLDAENGNMLWNYRNKLSILSLLGTPSPIMDDEESILYAGFANGKIVAFHPVNGVILWEKRIAVPSKKTGIGSIIDINATPLLLDKVLYVVAHQGNLAAINHTNGYTLWETAVSSYHPPSSGFGNIYVVTDVGELVAYNQQNGSVRWRHELFKHRNPTAVAIISSYLVLGDKEGYIHILSQDDGHTVARERIDRKGLGAATIINDNWIYVYANSGNLVALRLQEI